MFVGGETTYCNLQQKDLHCVMLYIVAQWSKKSPLFSGILFTLMWSRKPGWKSTVIVAPLFFLPPFLDTGLPWWDRHEWDPGPMWGAIPIQSLSPERLATALGSTSPTLFEQWYGLFYISHEQISESAVRWELQFFVLIQED